MHHQTDYLLVGGGASAMAFADTLLSETDAHITIVDRGHSPGGHWNSAYPFVRLHQPSAFYGVASRALGAQQTDTLGGNAGLNELATGAEICAYFQALMHQRFLPSGRVTYLPNCEMDADGTARCLISGARHSFDIARKTVMTCLHSGETPGNHRRAFEVEGVDCVTPSALAERREPAAQYVILGGGKTGMDVALWLLGRGVEAAKITWIMPRDAWLLDRRFFQPGEEFNDFRMQNTLNEFEAIIGAPDLDAMFDRLEARGNLLRLDPDIRPSAYKCATVTQAELARLRGIRDVVRMGHVKRISPGKLVLAGGEIAPPKGAVYIDCTANGLTTLRDTPIFEPGKITLQPVRVCQPTFSAAVIAYVEASARDDAAKNALCIPIPYPSSAEDWAPMYFTGYQNHIAWQQDPDLKAWLKTCRLDMASAARRPAEVSDAARANAASIRQSFFPAMVQLKKLAGSVAARGG
ncbi:MAG: NAD(P)-binding protein [Paracoccaceae bacterium]